MNTEIIQLIFELDLYLNDNDTCGKKNVNYLLQIPAANIINYKRQTE